MVGTCVLSGCFFAQEQQGGIQLQQDWDTDAAPQPEPPDAVRIDLDVEDKDLKEVLQFIAGRVGVRVIPDSNINETVTIRLENIDWRDALDAIAEDTGCIVIDTNESLIRFTQPACRLPVVCQDADIRVVLELLAKQAGANLIISPEVQGKVSLTLPDTHWRNVLKTVVEAAGYAIVRTKIDGVEIFRVVPPSLIEQRS